ncbi:MAG: TorF family putative porin [Burkholderiales bacterium]
MLKQKLLAAGIAGAVALPGIAFAQDAELPISANLTFTTDYVFRGISQNDEKFAVQGGFDFEHEATGIYVGTWASNVAVAPGSVELDGYVGWTRSFGDFGLDLGYIHYNYPGNSSLNTDEIYIGGSWKWFSATYYYAVSDEFFGIADGGGSQYFVLAGSYELPVGVTIGAHYGMTMLDGTDPATGIPNDTGDYDDIKVGLGYSYGGLDFELAYTDTDIDNAPDIAEDRVFFSVSKSF